MVDDLDTVKNAITKFVEIIAANGRSFEVEHKIAIVGFSSNETDGPSNTTSSSIAGGSEDEWVNTGLFDSEGNFKNYVTGTATYTLHEGELVPETHHHYVKLSDGTYSEMQYHEELYSVVKQPDSSRTDLYYYVDGEYKKVTHVDSAEDQYVQLTDNSTMSEDHVYYVDGTDGEKLEIDYGTCYQAETYNPKTGFWDSGEEYATGTVFYAVDSASGEEKKLTCTRSGNWLFGYSYTWKDENGNTYNLTEGSTVYSETTGWHYETSHLMLTIEDTTPVYEWATTWSYTDANGQKKEVPTDALLLEYKGSDLWTYEDEDDKETIWQEGTDVYTRVGGELNNADYRDALVPISNGENGQGEITASVLTSINKLSASGATRTSYGMKMADEIFKNNHEITAGDHGHVVVMFTDGQPGYSGFDSDVANEALESANHTKTEYQAEIYTVGLFEDNSVDNQTQVDNFMSQLSSNYQLVNDTLTKVDTKYYQNTAKVDELNNIFTTITEESTTTSTTVTLHADSIMRDILGTGMELMPGSKVSAKLVPGTKASETAEIVWNEAGAVELDEPVVLPDDLSTFVNDEDSKIKLYNINDSNMGDSGTYHPHTIDVAGFDYCGEYIAVGEDGHKLVVTIEGIEESPLAVWNQTLYTNNDYSGIWHAKEAGGERTLEASFKQPATILTSHNYVVDYAKTFVIDLKADIHMTDVQHLDADDTNRFDTNAKVTSLSETYGDVEIVDHKLYYNAKNMNWNGYDTFYVFGKTSSQDVLMHSANDVYDNLWSGINVMPANNIYYEDDFVTTKSGNVGIEYTGTWEEVTTSTSGQNGETAGSDVDGWIASMEDDIGDSDGNAHASTVAGSSATFTFTGTGVDIYSRTSMKSGIVVGLLYEGEGVTDAGGNKKPAKKGLMVDTLSLSSKETGEYYQIPTLSFSNLTYGTYTVQIFVNKASSNATGSERLSYHLEGIRVYNPLQGIQDTDTNVNHAYGEKEIDASFDEIRDCLIDAGSYGEHSETKGSVFIDKKGEHTSWTESTDVIDFEQYGSKNEVYLAKNQMITFAVDYDKNAYYHIGIKSITGDAVGATYRYEGQTVSKTLQHTMDLYYEVTPDWQDTDNDGIYDKGIIAIANTGDAVMGVTKLKVTNRAPAIATMSLFATMPREQMLAYASNLDMNEVVDEEITAPEDNNNQETEVPMSDNIPAKLFADLYDWFV